MESFLSPRLEQPLGPPKLTPVRRVGASVDLNPLLLMDVFRAFKGFQRTLLHSVYITMQDWPNLSSQSWESRRGRLNTRTQKHNGMLCGERRRPRPARRLYQNHRGTRAQLHKRTEKEKYECSSRKAGQPKRKEEGQSLWEKAEVTSEDTMKHWRCLS